MQSGENSMAQWAPNSSAVARMWERPPQGIHISLWEKPVVGYNIVAKLQVHVSLCGRFLSFREGWLPKIIASC
jgi:hypothetical protein